MALENASFYKESVWMDDKELSAILKEIGDSVRHAQAVNLANSYLLTEIVRDLADAARNRHDYLVDMFERINAHVNQLSLENQSHQVNGLVRVELSKFFAQVAKSPKAPEDSDHLHPKREI